MTGPTLLTMAAAAQYTNDLTLKHPSSDGIIPPAPKRAPKRTVMSKSFLVDSIAVSESSVLVPEVPVVSYCDSNSVISKSDAAAEGVAKQFDHDGEVCEITVSVFYCKFEI